jgi:hypothetical protein
MTDNIDIKDAAGNTQVAATDLVGGRHFQIVKTAFGANDTATQVSSADPLPVNPSAPASVFNGVATVTTAGTAVALAGSQALRTGVYVTAPTGNAGLVYVGGSSVSAANGTPLAAGERVFIAVANLSTIYVDAATNGDTVRYLGF